MKLLRNPLARMFAVLVLIPLVVWGLARLGDRIAEQRGESGVTRALRAPARLRRTLRAA